MISKDKAHQSELNILDSSQVLVEAKNQIIEQLKQLLPNVINSDNQLNTQALQDVLNIANTTSNNQGYELTFAGKGIAKAKADEPTTKELEVELGQSKDFDNTENVIIRGDNIDALKILRANYTNKIKMIYIDPPYNTKNENFVYNDNFKKSEAELIKEFGLAEETQNFLTNVYGTRSHSGWLSFMYPRLKIARELLKEDGVIFISIDDNEQANLKIICDEIFGEENLIKDFIVNTSEGGGQAKYVFNGHEYLYCYAKDKQNFSNLKRDKDIRGKVILIDGVEYWIQEDAIRKEHGKYGNLFYEDILKYKDVKFKEKIDKGIENKEFILVKKNDKHIIGKLRKLEDDYSKFHSIVKHLNKYGNDEITKVLSSNSPYFETTKPLSLLKQFIKAVLFSYKESNDIVLDFFAGSGTTGDAVMQLNAEDGGSRKYILAQLDEAIDEKKEAYKFCQDNDFEPVISSITIERLNRAGEKIKADIQAEFDAENSKSRPNKEKLAEFREKYIRVFGNSPSVKGWQSQTDGVVLEEDHPTDKVGTPPMEGNLGLDIGYKVFSLKDKPCIAEVTNDGGQVSFVPQNLRERTIDTLANMLCATCKPLHTKIETLIKDKLYKADNEIYLLGNIDKSELNKYNDLKINVDGYSDLDLEYFLNLGVTDKDNVSVVY